MFQLDNTTSEEAGPVVAVVVRVVEIGEEEELEVMVETVVARARRWRSLRWEEDFPCK